MLPAQRVLPGVAQRPHSRLAAVLPTLIRFIPQAAPDVIARGKVAYDANCASCHAADLRGTDNGINIIRKQIVMDDDQGELIAPILKSRSSGGQ